jgi:hypothetical protein
VESFSLAPRILASMSTLRFLALTILLASLPANAMAQATPQATPATVQSSASLPGPATDAASCSISVAGLLPGALRAHSATLSADGTRAVICSDRRVILVSTTDCTLLAQSDHPISIVESVILTRTGRVVVAGAGGAWSWDPTADTSRTILTGYVSMALHVGGEAVVIASEDAEGVLLRRVDASTGRITHQRLIPGGRQIYGLGFGPRGTLLVLTPSGVFGTNATLGRVTQPPLSFSNSYGERRDIALTAEGELPYEELLARRIFIAVLSQDGRRAVLSSQETYAPNAAPARWMSWRSGTALPPSVNGPSVSSGQQMFAVAPTGRALFCAHSRTSEEAERCWVLDL